MRGTIVNSSLMQSAHVRRSDSATPGWHVSPGTFLQQLHILSEHARSVTEREILRAHKLDMRSWLVLRALEELKYATQRQIVAATALDKVAVNRAASCLKEQNLVHSLPNTRDGRSHYLELSFEGECALSCCKQAISALENEMLDGLTQGEGWQFLEHLQQVRSTLADRV